MNQNDRNRAKAERLEELSRTEASSNMGQLLRRFWQPVAVSNDLKPGSAKPVRILSEDLTLYRGESGTPYIVGGRCAHRCTVLHTGWIEGDRIRCMYHGWQYDGTGQCRERPAENDDGLPGVKIASYPAHEYAGLIFAYMGPGEPPAFNLPRKPVFESEDYLVFAKAQVWPCNWFQQVENSLDAVHVSFVHQWGRVGTFGKAVSSNLPELEYIETDSGIRQIAKRSEDNIRVSDWTFPNNNYIVVPNQDVNDPWIENSVWMVPIDRERTMRIQIRAVESRDKEKDEEIAEYFKRNDDYNPANYSDGLFYRNEIPTDSGFELISAQDYVAQVGQGSCVDRTEEWLGESDRGVVFLRKIFWRELKAIAADRPLKDWRRAPAQAGSGDQSANRTRVT